jgi:hypothetical protein
LEMNFQHSFFRLGGEVDIEEEETGKGGGE